MAKNKKTLNNESQIYDYNAIIAQNKENLKRCLDVPSAERIFVLYDINKRPLSPLNCKMIDITSGNDLTTLDKALNACKEYKQARGIGIVLGETSKGVLCGIDIDGCIDEQGVIHPEAQKIVNAFDSYTEFSPSGKGVHILLYAKKKGKKCKINSLKWCKGLEVYDKNRYFTLTGNCINNSIIQNKQKELDIFYDKYFKDDEVTKITLPNDRHVADGELLKIGLEKDNVLISYFNGNRPNGNESSDDFGFMAKLMFWTNYNKDLAIKTFIDSPHAQQKDEAHKKKMLRKDYLMRTALNCKPLSTTRNEV